MAIVIRTAAPADTDAVADVFRRSSLSNDGDRANILANPEVLEFDDTCVREGRTRVAVDDDRVVGFVSTTPNGDFDELDDLFVDPDHTRRGIALALIRDLAEVVAARGVHRIEVTANNHALDFYLAAGFVVDGIAQTRFGPASRMHLVL